MPKVCLVTYYGLREFLDSAAKALQRLNYEVVDYPLFRYSTDAHDKRADYLEHFSEYLTTTESDIVLFWCLSISAQDLARLRELHRSLLFILFNWDDPLCWHVQREEMQKKAASFDLVFTTCADSCAWYEEYGSGQAHFLVPGFDPTHYQHRDCSQYKSDVSLCATRLYDDQTYPGVNRRTLIEAIIADPSIDFALYGPSYFGDMYPKHYRGYVQYKDLPCVYSNSAISLSTHYAGYNHRYINERTVQIPACRGLLLVDRVPGIEDIFEPDRECVLLDEHDPVLQIKSLLADRKRTDAIRKRGQERALSHYTWDHWAGRIHLELTRYAFDEAFYQALYGISVPNALEHWESIGRQRGWIGIRFRVPSTFDGVRYLELNRCEGIQTAEQAYDHWLRIGRKTACILPKRPIALPSSTTDLLQITGLTREQSLSILGLLADANQQKTPSHNVLERLAALEEECPGFSAGDTLVKFFGLIDAK